MKTKFLSVAFLAIIGAVAMNLQSNKNIAELTVSDVESVSNCEVYDGSTLVGMCCGWSGTCTVTYYTSNPPIYETATVTCDGIRIY